MLRAACLGAGLVQLEKVRMAPTSRGWLHRMFPRKRHQMRNSCDVCLLSCKAGAQFPDTSPRNHLMLRQQLQILVRVSHFHFGPFGPTMSFGPNAGLRAAVHAPVSRKKEVVLLSRISSRCSSTNGKAYAGSDTIALSGSDEADSP